MKEVTRKLRRFRREYVKLPGEKLAEKRDQFILTIIGDKSYDSLALSMKTPKELKKMGII